MLYVDEPAAAPILAELRDFSGTAAPKIATGDVKLQVLNGSGKNGAAQGALRAASRSSGSWAPAPRTTRAGRIAQTEVRYAPGQDAKGQFVLQYVSPQAKLVEDSSIKGADVVVVLGTDFVGVTRRRDRVDHHQPRRRRRRRWPRVADHHDHARARIEIRPPRSGAEHRLLNRA